jgi:hypothetical protein
MLRLADVLLCDFTFTRSWTYSVIWSLSLVSAELIETFPKTARAIALKFLSYIASAIAAPQICRDKSDVDVVRLLPPIGVEFLVRILWRRLELLAISAHISL